MDDYGSHASLGYYGQDLGACQDDGDEDSVELPQLRAIEHDELFLEELKLYPHNAKNVSK
jgi:hypothetical protein